MGGRHGEIIELLLSWIVTNGLTFLVVLLDERRLRGDQLERAWPPSSRDAAIIAFSVLALPFHFAKTRGHLRSARGIGGLGFGFLMGLVAAVGVALASGLVLEAIARLFGLPLG